MSQHILRACCLNHSAPSESENAGVHAGVGRAHAGSPEGDYDWRLLAGQVPAPTLVVHGDQDPLPLARSEGWVRALPPAGLVVIPRAGHYPHAERPELSFPAVEEFLAEEPP